MNSLNVSFALRTLLVVVVVVLTLTRVIKSVVTGQAPVTPELAYQVPGSWLLYDSMIALRYALWSVGVS